MRTRLPLVACLVALALPPVAFAQSNPFGPLPQTPAPTETQAPKNTGLGQDDGLKGWQQLAIFGGGIALIAGIAVAILSDARRHAPASDRRSGSSMDDDRSGAALRKPPKNRAKARQKGKRQKAARKRNR